MSAKKIEAPKKFQKKEYRVYDLSGISNTTIVPELTVNDDGKDAERDSHRGSDEVTNDGGNTPLDIKTDIVSDINQRSIRYQSEIDSDIKISNQISKPAKLDIQSEIKSAIKRDIDSDIKMDIKSDINTSKHFSLKTLSGWQARLFTQLYSICSLNDDFSTGAIITTNLANSIGCNVLTLKLALHRLEEKKLVIRLKGKGGRGGFINISIDKEIKKMVQSDIKPDIKLDIISGIKSDIKPDIVSDSSSSNIYKTTTNEINYSPLEDKGFSSVQLQQLINLGFTNDAIQESIDHFKFYLGTDEGKNIKHIGVLMKFMRDSQKPWPKPIGYISEEDKILEEQMRRLRIENAEKENMLKEKLILEAKQRFFNEDEKVQRNILKELCCSSASHKMFDMAILTYYNKQK